MEKEIQQQKKKSERTTFWTDNDDWGKFFQKLLINQRHKNNYLQEIHSFKIIYYIINKKKYFLQMYSNDARSTGVHALYLTIRTKQNSGASSFALRHERCHTLTITKTEV